MLSNSIIDLISRPLLTLEKVQKLQIKQSLKDIIDDQKCQAEIGNLLYNMSSTLSYKFGDFLEKGILL